MLFADDIVLCETFREKVELCSQKGGKISLKDMDFASVEQDRIYAHTTPIGDHKTRRWIDINGKVFKYLCSTRRLSERCEQPSEGGLGKWSGKTHVWLQDQIKLYDLQNTTEMRVLMRWARGNTM